MHYEFKQVSDQKDLRLLGRFIHEHALWYPRYDDWVEYVCIPEIDTGTKKAVVCWAEGTIVGNIIFQRHKQLPRTIELKNLRINPNMRGRGIAHFLVKQLETDARQQGIERVIGDTDERRKDILALMQYMGYTFIQSTSLYSQDAIDIIFMKEFSDAKRREDAKN